MIRLVENAGSGAPVCQEQAEADSLEQSSEHTDGNSVQWSLLGDDTGNNLGTGQLGQLPSRMDYTYAWSSRGEEDQ